MIVRIDPICWVGKNVHALTHHRGISRSFVRSFVRLVFIISIDIPCIGKLDPSRLTVFPATKQK